MQEITIAARKRESSGKGVARKLRAAGRIPAIFYGRTQQPVSIDIEAKQFENILHHLESENVIVNLAIGDEVNKALLRDVQHGPVRGMVLHADFYHVAMDQEINVHIPIHFQGLAAGVKNDGGIMQCTMRELEISCLPDRIPPSVDVDVNALNIGDSIHVRDIVLPGVKIVSDPQSTVVTIIHPIIIKAAPTAAEVEAEAAAAAAAAAPEPEVITERKREEKAEEVKEKEKDREKEKEKGIDFFLLTSIWGNIKLYG